MADVLGTLASVLTISDTVIGAVKLARDLYKAPEEIRSLEEHAQIFRSVVQTVERRREANGVDSLSIPLAASQKAVNDLHLLLSTKLLNKRTDRARRRAWLANRSKVVYLREKLKDAHQTLSTAISAELMDSAHFIKSSLVTMGPNGISAQSLAIRMNQKPEDVQSAIGQLSPGHITRHDPSGSWQNSKLTPSSSLMWPHGESSRPGFDCYNIYPQVLLEAKKPTQSSPYKHAREKELVAPVSTFEVSASFRPETYTCLEATPGLFSYLEFEEVATDFTRVNQYAMFYSKTPRHWIRITLSVTISMESRYWSTERAKPASNDMSLRGSYGLPPGLNANLYSILPGKSQLQQDGHLSVYLGGNSELEVRVNNPVFDTKEYLRGATRILHHMNCPRYLESEIIQRPLNPHGQSTSFIAYVDSRWVYEDRFSSDVSQIDRVLYKIQVLHCLRGVPGIQPLVGVVLDEDTGIVSGSLVELSTGGGLAGFLGGPIPWRTRLTWCKQIIQATAACHSNGFVVGLRGDSLVAGICLNGYGNAVIHRFIKTMWFIASISPLPPEYADMGLSEGSLPATLETDIYQLGFILWRIAANYSPLAIPSQLALPDETPKYVQEVIDCCQAKDPDQRAPAWKVLEMMSNPDEDPNDITTLREDNSSLSTPTAGVTKIEGSSYLWNSEFQIPTQFTRPEECHNHYVRKVFCDLCRNWTEELFFHCNICIEGDFDICRGCLDKGAHCLDETHYLRELRVGKTERSYYSNVKENGRRAIIDL